MEFQRRSPVSPPFTSHSDFETSRSRRCSTSSRPVAAMSIRLALWLARSGALVMGMLRCPRASSTCSKTTSACARSHPICTARPATQALALAAEPRYASQTQVCPCAGTRFTPTRNRSPALTVGKFSARRAAGNFQTIDVPRKARLASFPAPSARSRWRTWARISALRRKLPAISGRNSAFCTRTASRFTRVAVAALATDLQTFEKSKTSSPPNGAVPREKNCCDASPNAGEAQVN